jgi:ketosteroid isomerase-like protein
MKYTKENESIQKTIVGLEKAALERWNHGDPSGYLELSAPDVVYFDPYVGKRIDGLDKLMELYKPVFGLIKVDRYEMIDPLVQVIKKMAVLTFNLHSYTGEQVSKWNCTEVFRLDPYGKWKIIQTHWSLTQPLLK